MGEGGTLSSHHKGGTQNARVGGSAASRTGGCGAMQRRGVVGGEKSKGDLRYKRRWPPRLASCATVHVW